MANLIQVVERRIMGWNDRQDPFDEEDSFEDEYFDGDELDDDLLYALYDEEEYEFVLNEMESE
jgi:hypothetical protein